MIPTHAKAACVVDLVAFAKMNSSCSSCAICGNKLVTFFSRWRQTKAPIARLIGDSMSKPVASTSEQPAPGATGAVSPPEILLRTFTELRDELVSTLWFVLGNRDDAQDMAQEVFLRCWRAQDGLLEVRDLRAWIFRVGLNAAKDLQRSAWRRRSRPLLGEDIMQLADSKAPPQIVENEESLTRIRQALIKLRPEEKEVFLLRQNGELTYEQIAQMRNCPIGTIKTQMRTALEKLRKVLA
jgi:RNA polymerase sigma-70 factor (ECF subfamily)